MYGFIIKKSFCDDWDNLITVVLVNLITFFAGAGLWILYAFVAKNLNNYETLQNVLGGVIFVFGCILFSVIGLAFGEIAARYARFDSGGIGDFFKEIPGVLKDAILYGLLWSLILYLSSFCFEFYFIKMQSMVGVCIGSLLFWCLVIIALSFQWFIPIRSVMHNNFRKTIKKCFIIFFDNTGFSILVFLHTVIMIPLSIPLLGMFPSLAGILINRANAIRIRLYKYDYLEEHSELKTKAERKKIPWEELIFDDRDTLGPRTWRSFLAPWKEENK